MSQSKRQPLADHYRRKLDQYSDSMGEVELAEAADLTRLAISRARNGCRLNSTTRAKICAFLDGSPLSLTG